MASARSRESGANGDGQGGAASAAPLTNPLTIVTAAMAGDDLESVARSAADALDCPVAIALPAIGPTVQWPPEASSTGALDALRQYAEALITTPDGVESSPDAAFQAVPVRLGRDVLGVVAAMTARTGEPDLRPWLEAAAAAAAVTALMRDNSGLDARSARRALLQMLELHAPDDLETLLAQARRLGCDLSQGAVGVCAALADDSAQLVLNGALIAEVSGHRLLGLIPLSRGEPGAAGGVLGRLIAAGLPVAASAPRPHPADLRDALREAAVLLELTVDPRALLTAQEETYRLLVGVLLRDPEELQRLRIRTISQLEQYDTTHDTDLLATLEAFLAHHGSTTETAEAMSLHRHTVGYRLARVQEVSGLSPYESEGRERLSLGLKAHRIMLAEERRVERTRTG